MEVRSLVDQDTRKLDQRFNYAVFHDDSRRKAHVEAAR
jgi:hypothetical protein